MANNEKNRGRSVEFMASLRRQAEAYRSQVKETLSQSQSNFDTKKYFGYHPLVNNKTKDKHASSAVKLAASIRRHNESAHSIDSADSRGYRHSARSQGPASRGMNFRGSLDPSNIGGGRVSLKPGRGYDAVAESLHRIQ